MNKKKQKKKKNEWDKILNILQERIRNNTHTYIYDGDSDVKSHTSVRRKYRKWWILLLSIY